jgi:acetyltransferase-like isoleucine patch superfamily enzyme
MFRNLYYARRFKKCGKRFRLKGSQLEVHGNVEVGDDVQFRDNCIFRTAGEGRIIFGNYCGCSWRCIIEAEGLVQIGDFTGIAENTVIRDTNHAVYGTDQHWRVTPHITEPIIIGKSCLIGSGCYIGPGVTIGDGAVLAAGSVVTKNIGEYEIWAGNPARLVAHRTKNVPVSVQRRMEELISKYGVKEGRHGYTEEGVAKPANASSAEPPTEGGESE